MKLSESNVFHYSFTYHILYQLRPLSSDSFNRLKNVHFTVLNDLFNARVGRTINASSATSITARLK